jgi:CHAT domain-containing protein
VGDQALEAAIKGISRPKVLHIATHGFFLPEDPIDSETTRGKGHPFWKPEFQLFRSGLVFAGVNGRPAAGEDGILTALEASTLDLRGTRLVVLSACDTGVGTLKKGEGVYGLRRAFTIAGAEAIVMSLWQVSDHSTQELMAGFYKNLSAGLGRADSLRMIQVEMLKRPARKHPYYWASFIHAGNWAPLDAGP